MNWLSPVPHRLIPTCDSESFRSFSSGETGLPVGEHVGAFGTLRKNHHHEGIDLYVNEGTTITAVEDGVVVGVLPFTGPHADSPWWRDTWAVMVEGPSGVVCYGEITPSVKNGELIERGSVIGHVIQVLSKDKGRPMSMLHLELYRHGVREPLGWGPQDQQPDGLLDPTNHLKQCDHRREA